MGKHEKMGGRFWLGVGILLVLLGIGLFTAAMMEKMHTQVSHRLDRAAEQALSGEMGQAIMLARQAGEQWEKLWQGTAAAADQTPMDTIDGLFAQLKTMTEGSSVTGFAACCSQLAALIRSVADAHKPTWWNIL